MESTKQVDHFAESEKLIALAVEKYAAGESFTAQALLATAQVHATLAVAAATNRVACAEVTIAGAEMSIAGDEHTIASAVTEGGQVRVLAARRS